MANLNILIGAGFSKPAGLPLVSDISKYFNRRIYDQLRMHASGEWFWSENGNDVDNHNGSLNSDHIVYAFIFEEIMKEYGELKNYEEFYDFLIHSENDWLKDKFDKAKVRCTAELNLPVDNAVVTMFDAYQYQKLVEIFNYLIIDTLSIRLSDEDLVKEYSAFLEFLESYTQLRVFTLNHDLLLEHLFTLTGKEYTDGFITEGSPLLGDDEIRQPAFNDAFSGPIHIRKLHGSAGLYRYPAGIDGGGVIYRTGEIIYFKPTSHSNKHTSRRTDALGKVIQSLNLDPSPKFITGKNKEALIEKDPMYSALYSAFVKELASKNDLLIIGYSYGDDHINKVIERNSPFARVININPGKTYPFSNAESITNLKSIADLSTLK